MSEQHPQYPQQPPQHQYPQQQYPPQEQYPSSYPQQQPEDGGSGGDGTPPLDVGTARQLWWLVAALGILQGFAALAIVSGDRSSFVDTMLADPALAEAGVDVDRARMESLFGVGMGIVGLVIVAVTALFLVFVRSMARDRNWARMVLTMLGVLMVFTSIPVLFGLGGGALPGGADGMGLAMGAVQILQAVAAVGAIVLMHRKESNLYFLPGLSRKDEDR